MQHKAFFRAVSALPTLTPILRRICNIVEDPNSSSLDIARALQLDPVIAGKVLRLANSASIGMPRTVASMQNAVTVLGAKRIHSLVIVSSLSSLKNLHTLPFPVVSFWRHSIVTALIAEAIAKSLRRYDCPIDEYEVFSGALLHDIGKLIAASMEPEHFLQSYRKSISQNSPFFLCEQHEISHFLIGEYYAEHWGFPAELQKCISQHHNPLSKEETVRSVSIIHVADIMAHIMGFKIFSDEITPQVHDEVLLSLGLPLERLKVIAEIAIVDQKSIESLFDVLD